MGGWPILTHDWNAKKFDLFQVLTKLQTTNVEPFFGLSVTSDVINPELNLIMLSPPDTFTTHDELKDKPKLIRSSYLELMIKVTSLLTIDNQHPENTTKYTVNFTDIIDIGKKFTLVGTRSSRDWQIWLCPGNY